MEECVILDNCDIGRRAKLRRAILDKNVRVPDGRPIGYDLERDRQLPSRHRKRHRGGGRRAHARGISGAGGVGGDASSPMEQHILSWITEYGYAAIVGLLMLGIVGLPVPDETLLTFTGYLVFRGNLRCRWRSRRRSPAAPAASPSATCWAAPSGSS